MYEDGKSKVLLILLAAVVAFVFGFGGCLAANYVTSGNIYGNAQEAEEQPGSSNENAGSAIISSGGGITINPDGEITVAEAIAEKVMPSVVGITTVSTSTYNNGFGGSDLFDYFFGGGLGGFGFGGGGGQSYDSSAVGTGVIVDAKGYILTNSHVVNDGDYKSITVSLYDGTEADAKVLWNDQTLDLAVIKIEGKHLTAAELGDSDTVNIGAYAAAIGNPLGLQFERSMSQGIISGLNRTIQVSSGSGSNATTMEGLMQTDATINSGNSGGPLLNSRGQVIGINSAKAGSGEGMGFAIPINVAKPIVGQIMETGEFNRPYIGINGVGLEQSGYSSADLIKEFGTDEGIYVVSVVKGGGAALAGMKAEDIIVAIDGTPVGTMNKLNTILVSHEIGDNVMLKILRDGKEMTLMVKLTGEIKEIV